MARLYRIVAIPQGAPPNAAGILRVGCKLIVNAGVPQCVFALTFVVVRCFGWKSVSYEFGVQIQGMIWFS
jgi:hypothetical protein